MAKRLLSQRGIVYQEKDVSRDRQAALEMIRLSGQQGVPVIVVDGQVIVGFNRPALEQALARSAPPPPRFGASIADAQAIARKEGRTLPAGAYLGAVRPDTPAARAGLRRGDVLTSLDGTAIRSADDLERTLLGAPRGRPLELTWWRDGQTLQGTVVL